MKKRWIFILAVLMITATVFVACNSEVADANVSAQPGDELVYASFGGSKALTTEYSFIDYTQLYWFYQAEKKDSYGTTGQVTGDSWAKVPGDANRKGLDGTVGPFSQGLWAFSLVGYRNETTVNPGEDNYDISVVIDNVTYYYSDLVYSGTSTGTGEYKNEVNLKYGNSNAIPVTVAPSGETGKIALGTSTAPLEYSWYQSNGGTGALKLKVTVTPQSATSATDSWDIYYDLNSYQYYGYIYAKDSTTSTDLPTDNYNLVFTVCAVDANNDVAYEFAKQALSATVFGSQTTYVKGNLVEGLFVENAHFVATDVASKIVIADSTSVSDFVVDKTPVGTITNGTSVSIPAGELTSGTQNNMTIEVVSMDIAQDVASMVDFEIVTPTEDTANIAVAAIDITLKQVTTTTDSSTGDVTVEETSVKNFTQAVTITTYISPNLNGVRVLYNAQEGDLDDSQPVAGTGTDKTVADILTDETKDTGLGYHPASGLLRFQTTHFSQFFVVSDSEALNVTTGVYYSTLKEAIEKAESDQTIKVLKDISPDSGIIINKSLSLNTDNHIITFLASGASSNNNYRAFRIDSGSFSVYGGGTIDAQGEATSATGTEGTGFYGAFRAEAGTELYLNNITLKNYRPWGLNVKILGAYAELNNVTITSVCGGGIEVTDDDGAAGNVKGYAKLTNCTMTQSDYRDWCSVPVSVSGNSVIDVYSTLYSGEYGVFIFSSGGTANIYGGEFESHNNHPVLITGTDHTSYPDAVSTINVFDGRFTGSFTCPESDYDFIKIYGGIYDRDPSDYVVPGYKAVEDTSEAGWWIIEPDTPVITVQKTLANNTIENMAFFGDGDEAFAAAIEYAFYNKGGSSVISIKKNLTLQSDSFRALGDETKYDGKLVALPDEDLPNVIFDFEGHSVEMTGDSQNNFYFGNANVFFRNGTLTGSGDFGVLNHLGGGDLTVSDMRIIGTGWLGFALTCGGDTTRQHDNLDEYDVASLIVNPTAYLTCFDDWDEDDAAAIAGVTGPNFYEVKNDCNISIESRNGDIILFKFVAVESN